MASKGVKPRLLRRRSSSTSLSEAQSPTTAHVKAYVRRVSSKQLLVYPEWDITKPLPSLPIPALSQTLDTYLKVLKPISTDEQHLQNSELVKHFLSEDGEGMKLQQALKTRAICRNNWAYDWWLQDMYMRNKLPLPINSNPGMVFPRTQFNHPDDQLRFAARLVSGILDYKVIIDARGLPIDRANHREKGQPLCMEQYYRLFSTYREPGKEKDRLITTEGDSPGGESDHIIVICRDKMYLLDVVDGFNRLTEDDICCQLRRIRSMAEENTDHFPGVGILTSLPRDEWADARSKMKSDKVNHESLHLIETSIFILCLDEEVNEESESPRQDNSLALQMLHGHGSHLNSCNRWYDKTMQFVIGKDGACGLNYEHSPSEGIAVVQLIEHVLRYMDDLKQRKVVRMNSNVELPYPTKLDWNISHELIQHIDMARFQMDRAIQDLDLYLLNFDHFGKEFPKSQNMSPDCFIQLALQLTYFRLNGKLVSTYESASTRRFRLGRVDNIRAASCEALQWCQAMSDENNNEKQTAKLSMLRTAMQAQTDFMVQTILGRGMDCHMLGLKRVSEEEYGVTPLLFQDDMWTISNQFTLSTSQVNTSLNSFMGYGPVVPNGYGTSYNPQANQIIFCITAFNACPETSAKLFSDTLESVLTEMRDLCLSCPTPSPRDTKLSLSTIAESKQKSSEKKQQMNGEAKVNNNNEL